MSYPSGERINDIDDLINKYIEESTENDPRGIAAVVADELSDEQKERIFLRLLARYVQDKLRLKRNRESTVLRNADGTASHRVSAIRAQRADWWAIQMNERYFARHRWIRLGDMTKEDVLDAANIRRRHARENIRKAERFERLASVMHDVVLPDGRVVPCRVRDTTGAAEAWGYVQPEEDSTPV